jgi:hypothetical protein
MGYRIIKTKGCKAYASDKKQGPKDRHKEKETYTIISVGTYKYKKKN